MTANRGARGDNFALPVAENYISVRMIYAGNMITLVNATAIADFVAKLLSWLFKMRSVILVNFERLVRYCEKQSLVGVARLMARMAKII